MYAYYFLALAWILDGGLCRFGGMATRYFDFDSTVETYKDGLYKDLPQAFKTHHYHNDWIEIGMQVGMVGLVAYALLLFGWFQTLRVHRLATIATAFMCFIFLSGLTDVFVIFTQNLYLMLVITTIGVGWQKAYGMASLHAENCGVRA